MTSEQNVPEVESHQGSTMSPGQQDGEAQFTPQNVQHGMGQSKSSRRRRRKRKNKGSDAAAGRTSQVATRLQDSRLRSIQGSAAPQTSQPTELPGGAGQQQNNAPAAASAGRRSSATATVSARRRIPATSPAEAMAASNGGGYRDRDTHQPGNNAAASSARAVAASSSAVRAASSAPWTTAIAPSTATSPTLRPPRSSRTTATTRAAATAMAGRSYQSDSQPIDYSQGRTIPIPEDAPTKIFFFIEDLFFIAKIQETARKLGVKVAFVKNEKDAIAALTAGEEEDRPGLIVFDLNNANAKPLTLIPKLKAKLKRSTSIVGFLSHLQGDLKAKAVEAGCDTVMPRAAFSQNLPNLLRRYGMEEEEEPNFNQ